VSKSQRYTENIAIEVTERSPHRSARRHSVTRAIFSGLRTVFTLPPFFFRVEPVASKFRTQVLMAWADGRARLRWILNSIRNSRWAITKLLPFFKTLSQQKHLVLQSTTPLHLKRFKVGSKLAIAASAPLLPNQKKQYFKIARFTDAPCMNVYPRERLHRFRVGDTCSLRRCNWHAHGKRRPEPYHLPVTELPRQFLFKVYNTVCGITYTKFQEWRSPLRSSKSLQKEPQRIWEAEGFTNNYARRFFEPHANSCNDKQTLRTRPNYSHLYIWENSF